MKLCAGVLPPKMCRIRVCCQSLHERAWTAVAPLSPCVFLTFPHVFPPLKRLYNNRLAANASISALREMEVRGLIKRLRAAPPHPIEGKRSHGGNHSRVE